jgi:hypothetical protein
MVLGHPWVIGGNGLRTKRCIWIPSTHSRGPCRTRVGPNQVPGRKARIKEMRQVCSAFPVQTSRYLISFDRDYLGLHVKEYHS